MHDDPLQFARFRVWKCPCCGTWYCCFRGGAQGFDSWWGAFSYADALTLRLRK